MEKVNGWTLSEWPWTASVGERWVAFPPPTPPDQKWPGLHFFATRRDAVEAVG